MITLSSNHIYTTTDTRPQYSESFTTTEYVKSRENLEHKHFTPKYSSIEDVKYLQNGNFYYATIRGFVSNALVSPLEGIKKYKNLT